MGISKAGSLSGWSFKTWAARNKESFKLLISGLAGLATGLLVNVSPVWASGLGLLVSVVSKMALDTLDFWSKDVKIE